jgi:hypothetical protein
MLQYSNEDIFKALRTLQNKKVNVIFGEPFSYDTSFGAYVTYAFYGIPENCTIEAIEDKLFTEEDVDRKCREFSLELLDYWVKSIEENSTLVLRMLPVYLIENDELTGIRKVGFRVRLIGNCNLPEKAEGCVAPVISLKENK